MTPDPRPLAAIDDDAERDRPLRDDTRLLGRILGDVLREQTGDAGYERIEAIRQTAIRFRRAAGAEADAARGELAALLDGLPIGDVLERRPRVLLLLAPREHRRGRAPAPPAPRRTRSPASPPQRGTLAAALAHARAATASGRDAILRWCAEALVSARCSPRTRPRCSARASSTPSARSRALLVDRDRAAHRRRTRRRLASASCAARCSRSGRRRCCACRSCASSTRSRTALAYYRYTFLAEVPRLYATLAARPRHRRAGASGSLPPFLRMGSWIGGDRDGNPFVTAETLALRRCARRRRVAFGHHLDEVHRLGGELSLSTRLVHADRSAAGARAGGATTRIAHRQDEPYRQALIGVYARLAATAARKLGGRRRRARRTSTLPPYDDARRARRRPRDDRATRSPRTAPRALAEERLDAAALRGARRSASTSRRSTCARTRTCTRRSSPSCSQRAGVAERLRGARRAGEGGAARARARDAAPAALAVRRLLASGRAPSSRSSTRPRPCTRDFGAEARPALRDLEVPVGVRPARGRGAAEGGRARCATARSALDIVPLFETIDDLERAGTHHARGVRAAALPRAGSRARRRARR